MRFIILGLNLARAAGRPSPCANEVVGEVAVVAGEGSGIGGGGKADWVGVLTFEAGEVGF